MKRKSFGNGLIIHHKMYAIGYELVDSIILQQIVVHLTSMLLVRLPVEVTI